MKVGAYLRVSSEEQVEGYSLDAQRRAIRHLCTERGWDLFKEYADEGISARYEDISQRPGFSAILEDAKARKFDVLVVHKLDRFSRRLIVTLSAIEDIRRQGVTFLSISEQMDFTTPIGSVQLALLGAFAQYYSDNLSQETKKGMHERVKQGLYVGHVPFGYKKGSDGVPQVAEEEARVVREAFERYAAGGTTMGETADWITTQGFRTRNATTRNQYGKIEPRPFTEHSVADMLANTFYLGRVKVGGEEYAGQHPAIVTQELFDACAQRRLAHSRHPRTHSPGTRAYLLVGVVRCAFCGERMWVNTAKGRGLYYRDSAKRRRMDCYNPGAWVRIENLDAQVDALMRSLRLPPTWQLQVEEIVKANDEREAIAREAERIQEKIRRLNEQYRELVIIKSEYEYQRRRLELQLAALPTPPPPAPAIAGEELEKLLKVWDVATVAERGQMIRMVFESVYVDTKAGEIVAYRPKEAYRALFRLCEGLREVAGLLVTQRYEQLAGIGNLKEPSAGQPAQVTLSLSSSRTSAPRIPYPYDCHCPYARMPLPPYAFRIRFPEKPFLSRYGPAINY